MEGDVDALEGDGGETTLQLDGLGLGLGLLDALLDDADQVSLQVLERHALHQSGDVDVLGLEEVQEVGKAVEGAELEVCMLVYLLVGKRGGGTKVKLTSPAATYCMLATL